MAMFSASLSAFCGIQYTCDPGIEAAATGTCAALNGASVAGVYSNVFSNVNANIYIQYGSTGVGQSSFNVTQVSYTDYYNALAAHTDDPVALASLGSSGDPLGAQSNGEVDLTAALATSLGITSGGADTAGVMADGVTNCTLGSAGCYNGVITMATGGVFYFPSSLTATPPPPLPYLYDFYAIAEHETDEVLGTISCIGGNNVDQCNSTGADASPADLFRYASSSVRSFLNTSNGTSAYFSINGGATNIADYNNSPTGGDYGDWVSIYPYMVQDAIASTNVNLDISTDVGVNGNNYPRPEVAVLDAVGFNLAAPEPGTLGLIAASLALLVLVRRTLCRR